MIYLLFEKADDGDLKAAALRARNKLFELFSIDESDAAKTDLGKPYLKSGKAGFSISHSGELALCALRCDTEIYGIDDSVTVIFENGSGVEIGCDIEEFDPNFSSEKAMRLSQRFLGEATDSPEEFYRLWTRGEAYGKYTGKGVADAKNIPSDATLYSFEIDINNKKYFVSICT